MTANEMVGGWLFCLLLIGGVVQGQVAFEQTTNAVHVTIDGRAFTTYRFADPARPFFYPVIGPTGEHLTRHWPMREAEHEQQDHPHHRGLWFTHGRVNGEDFWAGRQSRVVHRAFLEVRGGRTQGVLRTSNAWVCADGSVACTDERRHLFRRAPDGRGIVMDVDVTLRATHGPVILGDTKEGCMAMRLAPTLRVRGEVAKGHILNSEGDRDRAAWGKRAAWCDYYGALGDRTVGVAIFDHPANLRHPTWWHVRDYGLFAANPLGISYFEGKPKGSGDLTIPAGKTLVFRYRIYVHEGDSAAADVAGAYRAYATP